MATRKAKAKAKGKRKLPPDERRCVWTRAETGKRCEAWAIRGGTVCSAHGGRAPQVKKGAEQRLAIAEAQRMVGLAGVDQHPIEHLLYALYRAAQLERVWSVMLAGLDDASIESMRDSVRGELHYSVHHLETHDELGVTSPEMLLGFNKDYEAQLHPFVLAHERALDRLAKIAKLCADAGVDERRVQIEKQRAAVMADVFRAVFAAAALGLSAAKQREAMVIAAQELRGLPT